MIRVVFKAKLIYNRFITWEKTFHNVSEDVDNFINNYIDDKTFSLFEKKDITWTWKRI